MKQPLKVILIVTAVSTLILNSACSSVIAPQQNKITMPDIPQQWTAIDTTSTAALQQHWSLTFNDPALVTFVQRAMQNNVDQIP